MEELELLDQGAVPSQEEHLNKKAQDSSVLEAEEVHIVQMTSTSNEDDRPKFLSRKRQRRPETWKSTKAKEALNLGVEHFNVRGKLIPAKQMKSPCVCQKKCRLKITGEERLEVHKGFWKLGSKVRQWDYIMRHSTCTSVKRRTTGKGTSRRNSSRKYFFTIGAQKRHIPVCKTMFTRTLAIGDSVIQTAYRKMKNGAMSPDKRGKRYNQSRKTSEERKATVRTHIGLYPRIPPRFTGATSNKEYIECGMSVNKMHGQYQVWCEENRIPLENRASLRQYRTLIDCETNIGFFKPKKDQCGLCNLMKKGTRQEREMYKERWISHIRRKKVARKVKLAAKNRAMDRTDVAVLTFELQNVLPCPKGETSAFFYKNKLSLFNLTMYEMVEHEAICYMWHEGTGKRGANEIGSAVFDCISLCVENGIKEIHSFSDPYAGQSKNRYIYAMFLLAAAKHSIKIRHTFLEPGHTQNESDSVHSRIENAANNKDMYDVREWIDLIEGAKVEEPRYIVKLLQRTSIFDFNDMVNKQNWDKDSNGRDISWNRVRIVEADGNREGVLKFNYQYDDEMLLLNTSQGKGRSVNLKTYRPPLAYSDKIPIKRMTVKHLKELCQKLAIPSKYHAFYQSVFDQVDPVDDDDDIALNFQVIADSHDDGNDIIFSTPQQSNPSDLNPSGPVEATWEGRRNNALDQNTDDLVAVVGAEVADSSEAENNILFPNQHQNTAADKEIRDPLVQGVVEDTRDQKRDHPQGQDLEDLFADISDDSDYEEEMDESEDDESEDDESDCNDEEDAIKTRGAFFKYLLNMGYISLHK